jgi:hypothetical protein
MEQRLALLAGTRLHLVGRGAEALAIEPRRRREDFRSASHTARAPSATFLTRAGRRQRAVGVVVEEEREPLGIWSSRSTRHGRDRYGRRQEREAVAGRTDGHAGLDEVRHGQLGDSGRRCQLEVMPIRPGKLLFVEHARAQPDLSSENRCASSASGINSVVVARPSSPDDRGDQPISAR